MRYILLTIVCFLLAPAFSEAQESSNRTMANYQIAVHPVYMYTNGLRVDLERRIGKTNDWLTLGLAGFLINDDVKIFPYIDDDFTLTGGMAELTYKHFIATSTRPFLFIAGGASFSHYNIKYSDYDYVPYFEDGLRYYDYRSVDVNHHIPKIGSHLSLGIQSSPYSRVFVDATVGIGYNYSFYDDKKYIPSEFYDYVYGLTRREFYFTGTFRIGVRIGKL